MKWTLGKKLYLTLAILLSVQVIPGIGTLLNMFFFLPIAGIVIAILITTRIKKDQLNPAGAILGIITFFMALISGFLMYLIIDDYGYYTYYDFDSFAWLWQIVNWCVCVAAVITCYINTFSNRKNQFTVTQGQDLYGQQMGGSQEQSVALGFDRMAQLNGQQAQRVNHTTQGTPTMQNSNTITPTQQQAQVANHTAQGTPIMQNSNTITPAQHQQVKGENAAQQGLNASTLPKAQYVHTPASVEIPATMDTNTQQVPEQVTENVQVQKQAKTAYVSQVFQPTTNTIATASTDEQPASTGHKVNDVEATTETTPTNITADSLLDD